MSFASKSQVFQVQVHASLPASSAALSGVMIGRLWGRLARPAPRPPRPTPRPFGAGREVGGKEEAVLLPFPAKPEHLVSCECGSACCMLW